MSRIQSAKAEYGVAVGQKVDHFSVALQITGIVSRVGNDLYLGI